jgi:tyrosine-protein kinase Etk/Wzc
MVGTESEVQNGEINILNLWRVLLKNWRMILGLFLVASVSTGLNCYFVSARIYESVTTILSPKEGAGGGILSALGGSLGSSGIGQLLGGALPNVSTNRDMFTAILKSRTMRDELVSIFNLTEHYGAKYPQDASNFLRDATDISATKEGTIGVAVEDRDPELAAKLANAYAASLDRILANMGTSDASRQRAFLGERLIRTEKALRDGEEALRRFQEKHKSVGLQEQVLIGINANERIKAELAAAEVALESVRFYATESNPQFAQQKLRVEELRRQLAQTQYGKGVELPPEDKDSEERRKEFALPFTKVPELGMELARLTREVKFQETLFTLLTQLSEQAKMAEAKDMPVVQIIDKAVPPLHRSKPQTAKSIALSGGLGLIVGIFLAFFLEYLKRLDKRDIENQETSIAVA